MLMRAINTYVRVYKPPPWKTKGVNRVRPFSTHRSALDRLKLDGLNRDRYLRTKDDINDGNNYFLFPQSFGILYITVCTIVYIFKMEHDMWRWIICNLYFRYHPSNNGLCYGLFVNRFIIISVYLCTRGGEDLSIINLFIIELLFHRGLIIKTPYLPNNRINTYEIYDGWDRHPSHYHYIE